jgi:hypothetical protein
MRLIAPSPSGGAGTEVVVVGASVVGGATVEVVDGATVVGVVGTDVVVVVGRPPPGG